MYRTHKELDLCNQPGVEEFFKKERPEYVFLAAAKVGGIWANSTYPAEFIYSNLAVQVNVIHNAYTYGTKKLLFLGSSCIYPKFCPQPMKEDYLLTGPLEPTNEPYAISKIAGIKMCQAYNRQYGTNFISVMPTNLYGPGDNFDLETSHVLPALIRKFHEAKLLAEQREVRGVRLEVKDSNRQLPQTSTLKPQSDVVPPTSTLNPQTANALPPTSTLKPQSEAMPPTVTIWGTGTPRREFLHVDDLADACVFLMNHFDASTSVSTSNLHPPTSIINIGVGKDISIRELAELIGEVVGFKGEMVFDNSKPDGTPRKLLDIGKIRATGWKAKIPLRVGIENTYRWFQENVERSLV